MWIFTKLFSWAWKSFDDLWWYSLTQSIFGYNSWMYKKYSQAQLLDMYKGWIFAASDAIGDWMAMLKWDLYKDDDKLKKIDHEYMKFIDSRTIKAISIYLKTLWEVYFYKVKAWNKIIELKMLKSWNVVEQTWDFWEVLYYTYFDWTSFYRFDKEDLLIFKSFSPLFEQSWMTPLKAAASQMAMDLASIEYNRLFFENGWKPWTVLKSAAKIDADIRDKYLAKWKQNFVWLQNSNKVAFLDQWIELQDFSANQKDMELTNQRTFTRDEILMMFRVWTPILWKSDGVWFADKKVPWYYLTQYALKPLGELIKDELNAQLFNDIWFFEFEFPEDKEDLMKEYLSNTITLNEYRLWTWKNSVKDWNRLWDWTEIRVEEEKQISESAMTKSIQKWLEKFADSKEFWTEEYNSKKWEQKIQRTDIYEREMGKIQKKIWNAQEKEIIENIKDSKSLKKVNNEDDLFDEKKFQLLYITLYTKFFQDMMLKEWEISIEEISDEAFAIAKINKWIGENIERMSDDIDKTTRKEIFEIIKEWNRDWLWADAIATSVRFKFNQYTRKSGRIEKVVRTEVTRASNKSQESAYEQSWVVEEKEWYTALDERVSQQCQVLHWTKIKVWWTFLKKGDKDPLGNKITYESIKFPPRHVNCRCTLRPIISRKGIEAVKKKLSKSNINFNY